MLSHRQVWAAIDNLATRSGRSASGLAKVSGLDPTIFNKSKRIASNGKLRWPSTESISKILGATGVTLDVFAELATPKRVGGAGRRTIPLIGLAQAGDDGFFDDGGFPLGEGWDEISTPEIADENAYALEISGDSMAPAYRDGTVILVSPGADIRPGDRVVVRTHSGEVMAKELSRKTAKRIELKSLNPEYSGRVVELSEVAWIARIVWASQ
jgi:phage repressor protein C with HTH and peptisase S24 domain